MRKRPGRCHLNNSSRQGEMPARFPEAGGVEVLVFWTLPASGTGNIRRLATEGSIPPAAAASVAYFGRSVSGVGAGISRTMFTGPSASLPTIMCSPNRP